MCRLADQVLVSAPAVSSLCNPAAQPEAALDSAIREFEMQVHLPAADTDACAVSDAAAIWPSLKV